MAIPSNELNKIKPFIHETAGNPNWIALAKKKTRKRK